MFDSWQDALYREFLRLGVPAEKVPIAQSYARPAREQEVSLGFNLTRQWSREHRMTRHLAWLVDHPTFQSGFFMASITGMPVEYKRCVVCLVDEHWTEFAREIYEFPYACFLPHAASLERPVPPSGEGRKYEVVLFGSLCDQEEALTQLFKFVDEQMPACRALVEMFVNSFDYHLSPRLDEALLKAIRQMGFPAPVIKIFMSTVFPQLDLYHRYKNRLKLIRSLTKSAVHIFGNGPWKTLNLPSNIVVHDPIPHRQVLEVMQQARVLLNHAPTLISGGHERVFDALACGCSVLSTESSFLMRELGERNGVTYFRAGVDEDALDGRIQELLASPSLPDRVAASQEVVFRKHHMGIRALQLCQIVKNRWPEVFGEPGG
ncbi:MAG: hypothetical protein A2X46_06140 [Lentisphaerae bacterium GWF2_57_35]|nr:MAG: hypothetical protein A2X46_06140 [Lentisphaerae bacterium GWF2_57_35]